MKPKTVTKNKGRKRMIFVMAQETENQLRELAELKDLAMSDIARRAIEDYYRNYKEVMKDAS